MSCDRSAPTGEKTLMSHWRGIMLTKGAIGNLINRYRAVLKKCNLMNVFGSLAVAGMLVMGGAAASSAATYFEEAPASFTTTIDQPNQQNNANDVTANTTVLVSGTNTNIGAETSMAVTGTQEGTYNYGSIWVTNGYAEAMNGVYNSDFIIQNDGKIFVSGSDMYAVNKTKGMSVNPNGKAINSQNGLIAVRMGSGMTDNSGSSEKSLINNGIISVEAEGGIGIYYRKEAITNGEVTNNGTIYASNGGIGVAMNNDKNEESYNGKLFTNTGNIIAEADSTAIFVTNTKNATVALKNDSHVEGLISLQGTDNKLTISNVGSSDGETLYVKGTFAGSIAGSNVAFTNDSERELTDTFSIDKDSTVTMSNISLAQGTDKDARGSIVIDQNGLNLNGGLLTADGTIESFSSAKGDVTINGTKLTKNTYAATSNYPVVGALSASMAENQVLNINKSEFDGNTVQLSQNGAAGSSGGAAISVVGQGSSSVNVTDTILANNSFQDTDNSVNGAYGGAMGVQYADVTLKNVTMTGNSASSGNQVQGGAYYQSRGSLNASQIHINENVLVSSSPVMGGGMSLWGVGGAIADAEFSGNAVTTNDSGIGGGLYVRGSRWGGESDLELSISNTKFAGNSVASNQDAYGGGLYIKGDTAGIDTEHNGKISLNLTGTVFDNNIVSGTSVSQGGALFINGAEAVAVNIADSTFANNKAKGNAGQGGAIYNGGKLTFSGTNTFDNNTAAGTANDIHNKGTLTVASGVTDLNSGYTQEGENSQLNVATGGVLSIAMPDKGGVNANSNEALLALGQQLDLSKGGKLHVGDVNNSTAGVAFGSNSVFVVDGKIASEKAMIKGSGSLTVEDGSQLYIANAKANTPYTITQGLTGDSYWDEANLLANRLIKATVSKDDDAVMVKTEVKDVASALPGVIPVAGLTTMLAQNLNDTDSGFMGVRFLSRATEPLYMSDDGKAVATINEVSRAAVTAGVQNTSLRLSDAASDTVLHHLSLGNFDSGNSIHQNGWDIWATPMYGNTYTHGMSASGASVRGNYGGLAIGADTQVGTLAGGNVRMGAAINGGGGKSETSGTATDTENSYNFGGVNLYAGWNLDNLNIMAALGYSMGSHDVKMNLPASLGMGQAKADVDSHAFTADLRAEYQFKTDWLDILPHAGVRYTALHTDGYDLKVNGSTLNSVDSDTQNIVQFPIGVTVTKNIDVAGWNIKPQADVSVIPAAGDKKASTKVSFSGIDAADSVNTRIMDSTSWAGMLGIQAEKGNLALGLNYGVQASRHETDQKVQFNIGWKF